MSGAQAREHRDHREHRERGDLALVAASLAGVALVVAALLLLVAVRVGQTRAGYAVHDLRAERTRLAQERAALEVERASLLRPARLSQWARAEAGLAPVEPARVVVARNHREEAR